MTFDFKNASPDELKREYKRIASEVGDDQFFTRRELNHLPSMLFDHEQVVAFSSGVMDSSTWLIVLTDKRIIFLDKGLLYGLKHQIIDLDKVSSISGETGLLMGKIKVSASGSSKEITNVPKKTVGTFSSLANQAISSAKSRSLEAVGAHAPEDKIERLERLAKLKESGILTKDEFETEKAKILSG